MNLELRVVLRQLGLLLLVLSAVIGAVGMFAVYERFAGHVAESSDARALWLSACAGAIGGSLLYLFGQRAPAMLGQREALLLVALSWVLGAGLSAMPFWLWAGLRPAAEVAGHPFDTYVNCYFEAISGLTTTGATVVTHLATLPRSLLLWRAMTHWLGGLGIVVLFVAILPMFGMGSRRLYRVEAPGPSPEGVKPRIQDTARLLWYIYCGLTVAEIVLLRVCGMGWFDSVCHTMATLATGGFGTQDASIAAYPSAAIHVVIIVFMVAAGINFGLYYQIMQGQWRSLRTDPELRTYLCIVGGATVLVIVSLRLGSAGAVSGDEGFGFTVLHSLFQVVAIQTTTGFVSADFDQWGAVAKLILVALMFVGASAGSTGGGIKVVRILIAAKVLWRQIEHAYRPRVVRPLKLGRATIDTDLRLEIVVYIISVGVLFVLGATVLMLLEGDGGIDVVTAFSASAATLNNIGPGLGLVGATENYAWFSAPSKIVMCVLMLLGRLEIYTILVLLSPKFWRTD